MRSTKLGRLTALVGAALLALPAAAQEEGQPDRGRPGRGGAGQGEGAGRRGQQADPRMRMQGRTQEPPPAMAVSGGKLFIVLGRELRRLDADTLEEEKKAEIPLPGVDDEAETKAKERFIARFDEDGDGFIAEDELPRPEILRRLDKDGDGKVSVSEAPGPRMMQARTPTGPATLLVEEGSVYVFQGGMLYRFDAESLEIRAKAELAPEGPGAPGMPGGRERPDRGMRGEDRPRRNRPERGGRAAPPDEPDVPDDPVRF